MSAEGYAWTVAALTGIHVLAASGLNVIFGYAGQPHLGAAAYMGLGAYATALLTTRCGLPWPAAAAVSSAFAFLFAGATGLLSWRLSGDRLALATIGLAILFESVVSRLAVTGGPLGIVRVPPPALFGAPLSGRAFALLALALAAGGAWSARRLERSAVGLAWRCLRDDETAARVRGIRARSLKCLAFAVGGGYCGLGGALLSLFLRSAGPNDFGFLPSLYLLAYVVVGGSGSWAGPVMGAALLTVMTESFRFIQEYRNLAYGIMVAVVLLIRPGGLAAFIPGKDRAA